MLERPVGIAKEEREGEKEGDGYRRWKDARWGMLNDRWGRLEIHNHDAY